MRRALVAVTACLLLYGCLDEQKTQIDKCRIEGQLAFTTAGRNWEDGNFRAASDYIYLCMGAAGYEWNWHGKFCEPKYDGSERANPYCYRPKGAIEDFLTDVEIAKNGGFSDWRSELWCKRMRTYTPGYCWNHGGWFAG